MHKIHKTIKILIKLNHYNGLFCEILFRDSILQIQANKGKFISVYEKNKVAFHKGPNLLVKTGQLKKILY